MIQRIRISDIPKLRRKGRSSWELYKCVESCEYLLDTRPAKYYEQIISDVIKKGNCNDYELALIAATLMVREDKNHKPISGYLEIKLDYPNRGRHRCFWYLGTDGNWYDFSTSKAFENTKQIKKRNLHQAFRQAIEYQIENFRKNNQPALLALHAKNQDPHVDHIYTFDKLIVDFCRAENIDKESIEIVSIGQTSQCFVDKKIESQWQQYHQEKATLRIVSKEENLGRKRS